MERGSQVCRDRGVMVKEDKNPQGPNLLQSEQEMEAVSKQWVLVF